MPTGIYIRTDKTRKILSESQRGKHFYWRGKKLSEEHKRKIGDATLRRKEKLGFIISPEARLKLSIINKGKKLSEETKNKISISKRRQNSGSKSHLWKGGITSDTNKRINSCGWRNIRKEIYKRDNYTCQTCKIQYKDKNGNGMNIHHIVPYRITQDNSMGNLITLCDRCHAIEEHKYYNLLRS